MLNTATTFISYLQEEDTLIKNIAIDKLEDLVDDYWAEISDYLTLLEGFYTQTLDKKELTALIISKIYYNLEVYDSAITWALLAGSKLNIEEKSQYVNTILKKIIDNYINKKKNNFFNELKEQIDLRIEAIIERIFNKCIERNEINQAIGLSLESFDLDRVNNNV